MKGYAHQRIILTNLKTKFACMGLGIKMIRKKSFIEDDEDEDEEDEFGREKEAIQKDR